MDSKQQPDLTEAWDARDIIRKGELTSELEFERAVWAERSLNLLVDAHPELEELRKELLGLITRYESLHWSDFDSIPQKQFKESDIAEKQVKNEFKFLKKRKELILTKLKGHGLNQNDFAAILAHSKSYTSELLSGTRSFSISDLVIIHKLLSISLEDLICTDIPAGIENKFLDAVKKAAAKKAKVPAQITPLVKSLSGIVKVSNQYNERDEYRKHIVDKYS